MAATHVYATIKQLPTGYITPNQDVEFSDIAATPDDFALAGGQYAVDVVGATFGSVTLTKRGPDNSTYLTVGTSTTFSANGSVIVFLGPGVYRLAIA